jgi:hypothetical protein
MGKQKKLKEVSMKNTFFWYMRPCKLGLNISGERCFLNLPPEDGGTRFL